MIEHKEEEIIAFIQEKTTREKGMRLLMNAYQTRLYWHIHRLVYDEEGAKDILQETFIKAYQNIASFKKESKLYTWLYRIATNEALQYLDKLKKMPRGDDKETVLQNKTAFRTAPNADEIQNLLQNAIHTLPEKQKLVFSLRYYDEIPYEEMSQILDMSVGTLKTNYHYAKEKIEKYIVEHAEEF